LTSPLNLRPATIRGVETDRDGLVADLARQVPDDIAVIAIEGVCDAKHPGQPLYTQTLAGLKGGKTPVPGGIRRLLRVITGDKGAQEAIPVVETGNIEFQDHVAAHFVVLPRYHARPADIVQPARNFEEVSLTRTVLVEGAKPVEKSERESRDLFAVRRIRAIRLRCLDDE
jgi:hypothetical protein